MNIGENKIIRQRLVFSGRVQGVGFRWRAKYAAESLGVTGFVRNRYDGSVEMEAEGTEEQLGQLLESISRARFIWIERVEEARIKPEGDRLFRYLDDL